MNLLYTLNHPFCESAHFQYFQPHFSRRMYLSTFALTTFLALGTVSLAMPKAAQTPPFPVGAEGDGEGCSQDQ